MGHNSIVAVCEPTPKPLNPEAPDSRLAVHMDPLGKWPFLTYRWGATSPNMSQIIPMYSCMHTFLDGWMDGWIHGWIDGFMDGFMDGWMDGRMDGWREGGMHGGMEGWRVGGMDGWIEGGRDGWIDGRMDRGREGRMDVVYTFVKAEAPSRRASMASSRRPSYMPRCLGPEGPQ